MRHFIKRILGKGEDDSTDASGEAAPYEASLRKLLGSQDHLHIVQVGANDGLLNDPLHDFVREARDRTTLLLIEPQERLIPILRENYSFHPSKVIFQGALGPPGELTLYAVSRTYWPRLRSIPYALDWPAYRAPTGVTSFHRSHVAGWLERQLEGEIDMDQAIVSLTVESLPLKDMMERTGFPACVDVLQVDAEGYDDQVIYHSNVPELRPRIIHFESTHLSAGNLKAVTEFLREMGYSTEPYGDNTLALLGSAGRGGGGSAGA